MVLDDRARAYLESVKPATRTAADADHARWSWLHAQLGSSNAPRMLRESLYFLQAAGSVFEPTDRGMRLVPSSTPQQTYAAIRDEILTPHAATLAPILREMRRE